MNQNVIASKIFHAVESSAFGNRVQVASSLPVFRQALRREVSFQDLVRHLQMDPNSPEVVTKRIASLAQEPIDDRYANPFDVPIAAYLLALSDTSSGLVKIAAASAARAPQTWWARSVAFEVLRPSARSAGHSEHYSRGPAQGAIGGSSVLLLDIDKSGAPPEQLLGSFGDVTKVRLTADALLAPVHPTAGAAREPFSVQGNGAANTWSISPPLH
jgi:hypothetical protein